MHEQTAAVTTPPAGTPSSRSATASAWAHESSPSCSSTACWRWRRANVARASSVICCATNSRLISALGGACGGGGAHSAFRTLASGSAAARASSSRRLPCTCSRLYSSVASIVGEDMYMYETERAWTESVRVFALVFRCTRCARGLWCA
eukprot:7110278-Prymnesium_polylepis.1